MTVHPTLGRLFTEWGDTGIDWCLLRRPSDLAVPRGDLDLLVAAADLPRARLAAERLGFVLVPGRRYGTHLLQYDRASACWLWLHIVTELTYGPYRALVTDAADECLARRVREGPVALLAADDEFWAVLLHCLLDRGTIAPGHRERLRTLAPDVHSEGLLAAAFRSVAPPEWTAAQVVRTITAREWPALETIAPRMRRRCARRASVGLAGRLAGRVRRSIRAIRELRLRRGVSVALLGPDGAGKSTLAAGLEEASVFPVRQVYMGLTGGMLRYVDKLRIPGIVRVGRLLVIWGRYLRAQYFQARGALVIFDRYIYDADVPPPYRLNAAGRLARWIDGRSCPPPDLVVILDAPGAVMHRRKGEYTPEMLEEWRRRFLSVRRRVSGVEIIDATQPAAAVRADVLQHVWRRYAARWTTA